MAKRVVHMLNSMGMGGIENFIMNVYRNLDRNEFQFDFILQNDVESFFEEEIEKLGGNIYKIPRIEKNFFRHLFGIWKILKRGNYIAFHRHTANSIVFLDLLVAKLAGIRNIIVHSHSTSHSNELLNKLFRPLLYWLADKRLACGKVAGEWLYGKRDFEVVNNGVPIAKYAFNMEKRVHMRESLGFLRDDIVLRTCWKI